ncbi:MAG: methionyl-tRNA formyltransferase [Patescibacteria group bacterium]|nr:methionyl-tRNA formyltransferase [Patescibacteria group bacterium]
MKLRWNVRKQTHNILFLGTPEFAIPSLKKLLNRDDFLISVITQPSRPVGRKQELETPAVAKFAQAKKINLFQPEKLDPAVIEPFDPTICVVVAYGKLIPKEILKIPKFGFINLHPSLLPDLRGPSPIQTALLRGYQETGVSVMQLDEGMDSGPILAQEKIKINEDDNALSLSNICAQKGAELLDTVLDNYLHGKIIPQPQDDDKSTICKLIKREDGEVNLEKDDPQLIFNKFRAFNPWPGIYTIHQGKRFKLNKIHLDNEKLVIDKIQPEGKSAMPFAEFKKGHPDF